MFSSVCTGCADGELVEVLKLHAKSNNRVGYLALVPDTFSQTDLANFKENLGIPFPVEVANGQLAREWSSLSRQFGPKRVNGLVFVMSKGEVVSMAQGVRETESLLKGLGE